MNKDKVCFKFEGHKVASFTPKEIRKNKSYSFETKLRHHCSQLDKADKKFIPRSTLSYWNKSKLALDFKTNTFWENFEEIENIWPIKNVFNGVGQVYIIAKNILYNIYFFSENAALYKLKFFCSNNSYD